MKHKLMIIIFIANLISALSFYGCQTITGENNETDNVWEVLEGSWEIVDFAGTINNFHSEIEETSEYNEQIEKLISEKSENTIGKIIQITDETVYGYYPLSEMGYFVDNESSLMCVTHFLPNGDETVFPYLTLRVKLIDGEEYIFLIDSNNEAFCGIDNYYWEVKNISADITNSFANINNDEQNDRNGVDNHKIIYSNFILGDRDVLESTQQEKWFIPDFQNDGHNYEYMFLDLNEDGDEELLIQMEDNPGGYNAVFHFEEDKIVCWCSDSVELTCFEYSLRNGLMVNEYQYNGTITYSIFNYLSNGEKVQKNMLWYRENDFSYNVDNIDVTKEEFENEYKSLIQEQLYDSVDWISCQNIH